MRAEKRIHEVPLHKISPPPANVQPSIQADGVEDEIDLAALVGTLYEGRWLIAALTALALLLGGVYAFTATPIFKADALVQVEESGGADPLQDLTAMFSGETPAEAEIEILRSRSVVADAVKALRLDIHARPMHAPLVGGFFARRHSDEAPASPLLGMGSYAWGGERIDVRSLEVPRGLEGEDLVLVADSVDGFRVLSAEGDELVRGRVGEPASGNGVEILVTELSARPGTRFELKKLPFLDAVSSLQEGLRVREKGKQTGVIQLEIEGPDRQRVSDTLDALMAAYLRRNVEHKAEEAQKTLDFVRAQLPVLKANLEQAELKLKEYRAKSGRLDLTIESQALVDRAAEVEKAISELELQRAELRQRFTDAHPQVTALRNKVRSLNNEKKVLAAQAKSLPENELESVRLVRDVTVANELYVLLLTKAQEIDVMKSGTIGNVRVIDSAVTHPKPVSPKKGMTLALSLMLGLFAGVGLVFLRKALNRGVEDPDLLEGQLGLPVYASLPFSQKQTEIAKSLERKKGAIAAAGAHGSGGPGDREPAQPAHLAPVLARRVEEQRGDDRRQSPRRGQVVRLGEPGARARGHGQARAADRRRPAQGADASLLRDAPRGRSLRGHQRGGGALCAGSEDGVGEPGLPRLGHPAPESVRAPRQRSLRRGDREGLGGIRPGGDRCPAGARRDRRRADRPDRRREPDGRQVRSAPDAGARPGGQPHGAERHPAQWLRDERGAGPRSDQRVPLPVRLPLRRGQAAFSRGALFARNPGRMPRKCP